jgi:hypothetical protein
VVATAALAAVGGGVSAGAGCLVFDDKEVADVDGGLPVTDWVAPGLAYLELDAAVRACRWALECPHLAASLTRSIALPIDDTSFSLCLHWTAGELASGRPGIEVQRALLEQVADAASCEAALAAVWVEDIDPDTDARCAGPVEYRCEDDGAVAIDCGDRTVTRCSSPRFVEGTACTGSALFAACASGTCPGNDAGLELTCAGEVGTICAGSLRADFYCPPLGLTCGDSKAFCAPEGGFVGSCSGPGNARCAGGGERVEVCASQLGGSSYDCTRIDGGACAVDGPARCIRSGAGCTILDADGGDSGGSTLGASVDVCNGNTLRACVDGQPIAIDCGKDLACLPAGNGVSGRCGSAPN